MSNLPDNVLLDIFEFYRNDHDDTFRAAWKWHILVHVCRRWRQLIFDSPLRLDLQILCTYGTPVKNGLGIWPNLPIAVDYFRRNDINWPDVAESILSALGHPDRVTHLNLALTNLRWRKLAAVVQKPFPVLRCLIISTPETSPPTLLPADFLEGSAPRLQDINLFNTAFPALPTLLRSASDLVELNLAKIPPSGYISPEVMVACLADLPRLKTLLMRFKFTSSNPHPRLSSITRAVPLALTRFEFQGTNEYLEDFTARIICPRLDKVDIYYIGQTVDFQVVQLSTFFDLSLGPEIFGQAKVSFDAFRATLNLYRLTDDTSRPATTVISDLVFSPRTLHAIQMLRSFSVILSSVAHIRLAVTLNHALRNVDDLEWLHLLHEFSAATTLFISREFSARFATALKSFTGEMVAEALPSLHLICLEGQPISSIEKFIAVRKLSGRPVTAVGTEEEFDRILKSYSRNEEDNR